MVEAETGRNDVDDALRPLKPAMMYGWVLKESAQQLVRRSIIGVNEEVRCIAPVYDKRVNFIILTRLRLVYWKHTPTNKMVDVSVRSITSAKLTGNDYYANLIVYTGSDSVEFDPCKRSDAQRLLDQLRAEIGRRQPTSADSSPVSKPNSKFGAADPTAIISKLFDLHVAGAISKEEFEEKKREILRRI